MMKLKACPRCRGDLIVDQFGNTLSESCLQCGYEHESNTFEVKKITGGNNRAKAKLH